MVCLRSTWIKVEFERGPHTDRRSLPHGRCELPLRGSFNGKLIQPHAQPLQDLNVTKVALSGHLSVENDYSFKIRSKSRLGVLGF